MTRRRIIRNRILPVLVGIILLPIALALLLLLLIFLLIACLGKIRYRINARVGDETSAQVEVSYFLWLVKYAVDYTDSKMETQGRIAWVRLGKEKTAPPKPAPPPKSTTYKTTKTIKPVETTKTAETKAPPSPRKEVKQAPQKQTGEKVKKEKQEKKDPLGFIKQAREFMSENEVKKIIGLTFQCMGKFLKALRPKHIDISGIVGFDDPATTGWTMGAYEAIVGISGLKPHIRILGSYHEKALRLDVNTRGRTRLGSLIWPFIWLTFKMPVRRLIFKLIFGK
ncbi:MAG: hypothetical protein FWC73_08790 [Defluviitaleaceae bacterium]|nr:hypothetical protein [Defluviitaleaceae bacterium]